VLDLGHNGFGLQVMLVVDGLGMEQTYLGFEIVADGIDKVIGFDWVLVGS